MPNENVQFGGQTLIIPNAYYIDNVSAALPTSPALVPPLVWLVFSYGGQPNVPQTFTTAQDVLNFLRGAPASDMVPFIFTPSSELNGASLVTVIPVGSNTPASYTYLNGSGSPVLSVDTVNYGLSSNFMQTSVVAGSIAGHEITLYDGYSGASVYADNLGVPFQLAYTGSATGVTFTVTQVGGAATTLTTTGAPAGENVTIQLGSAGYSTVAEVAEYLNGTGFYSANVLASGPNYSHGNLPSNLLDAQGATALNPPASGNYQMVNCTAVLTDKQYWMQTSASSLVANATLLSTSDPANDTANIPLTHFSGGTNVPPILSDYATALNVALTIPAWVVIADQNVAGLPALLAQHAITASSVTQGRWRRAISGSNVGDSASAAESMAVGLNTSQMSYCWPGIWRNSFLTGQNTLYGGVYVAAAAAGIMAGNPVMTPLTNKTLTGTGVEVQPTVAQIDALQQAGVMPIWVPNPTSLPGQISSGVQGVPTIVSDMTTWQNDNNPENVFNQQIAGRQYLAYVMVAAMKPYTGSIESSVSIVNQKKAAAAALNGQLVTPTSSTGVLNSWDNSSLKLNYTGSQQLTSVTFNCTFVGQNRFTTIEAFVQPLNLSA